MRLAYARRALPFVLAWSVASAHAQTRDEIRQQNEQLYQQYQQNGDQGTAPPIGGGGGDAPAYASPPPSGGGGSAGGGSGGGNLLVQLLDRVNRLEEQNRQLSGRVDELERNLQTDTAGLNKQIGDLSFAVQQGHGAAAPAGAAAAYAPGPPAIVPTPAARAAGRGARLAAAPAVPPSPPPGARGAGAAYRLANAYATQGNYRQAALTYYDVYNRQPHGPLAADALLHVGSSMIALGQNGAACEALAKVRSEFPAARPNLVRSEASLRTRAHC